MIKFASTFTDEIAKSEALKVLTPVLPCDEYSFYIQSYDLVKKSEIVGEAQFTLACRVDVKSKDDVAKFLTDIGRKSGTAYNTQRGDRVGKGTKVIVSGQRKCHHNIRRHHLKDGQVRSGPGRQPGCDKIPGKNTECPAKMKFVLSGQNLHTSKSFGASSDMKMINCQYPLELNIEFIHNHSINSSECMKYRPISDECKAAFTTLFEEDHSPSSALAQYQKNLKENYSESDYMTAMADRSVMPDYMWSFYYHRRYVESTFGSLNGPDAYKLAEERVRKYNEKNQAEVAKIQLTSSGEIIVVICDTFCRRVHEHVPQAGDIVLMDATSNLDRHDTKLFHLICPSAVGGFPLGNIITSKEDEATICAALTLFKSVLPRGAFFGRGPDNGPKILMTDDADAERNALRSTWPNAILLLCIFHLLQAFWRWLWDATHKISKEDRPKLYNLFKPLVFVDTDKEYDTKMKKLLRSTVLKKYKNLASHLKDKVLPRKNEWSLVYRYQNQLTTHNVNTTNYAEVSFRLTKEGQFNRMKAYNLPDLLDIILDDSIYYVNRCIDIGNNRTSRFQYQKSRYFSKRCNIDPEKIVAIDTNLNTYLVPSESIPGKFYEVNMNIGLCECPQGMLKGPCKHKHLVVEKFKIVSADIIPSHSPQLRAFYHFLGTGERRDPNWYRALTELDPVKNTTRVTLGIFDFMKQPGEDNVDEEIDDNDDTDDTDGEGVHANTNDEGAENLEILSEMIENDLDAGDENDLSTTDGSDFETDENEDEDEDDTNETQDFIKNQFLAAVECFSQDVAKRLSTDFQYYEKAVKSFTKKIKNVENMNTETAKKALYSFQNETVASTKRGRKKKGRAISVQSTSKSRRTFKARGSTSSRKGRPRNDVTVPEKRSGECVSFCLPKQKKAKKAHPHSITKAVAANRAAEKKH